MTLQGMCQNAYWQSNGHLGSRGFNSMHELGALSRVEPGSPMDQVLKYWRHAAGEQLSHPSMSYERAPPAKPAVKVGPIAFRARRLLANQRKV